MPSSRASTKVKPEEVRVERDPETGRILRIIRPAGEVEESRKERNPLNDPLNDIIDLEETQELPAFEGFAEGNIVSELEAQAAAEAEEMEQNKRPRRPSTREEEWLVKLVDKYGDDTDAMARDRKLNPMQQTAGDIGRRLKKWNAKQNKG